MQLTQEPNTEAEYWETIETIGAFIYAHIGCRAQRAGLVTEAILIEVSEANTLQERLVAELDEKFGILHPRQGPNKASCDKQHDPPPKGKRWYWPWYYEQKLAATQRALDGMICSACPLFEGVEKMASLGQVPCSIFPGTIYQLDQPHRCAVLHLEGWTEAKLKRLIYRTAGKGAVPRFNAKQRALQAKNSQPE